MDGFQNELLPIANYSTIRDKIDDLEENSEIQNVLQVSYLFGIRVQEIVDDNPILGNDFHEETIEKEEALVAEIPTAHRGWKPRYVAVPLNPKYEPWSRNILDWSEMRYGKSLSKWKAMKSVQRYCFEIFKGLYWPMGGNKKGKYHNEPKLTTVTHRIFREIRACELSFCNRFSQFDITNYLGLHTPTDYKQYFNKLYNKTDIYSKKDIIESIILKNMIFQPRSRAFFDFRTYMNIQKMIKKGIIKHTNEKLNINTKIDRPPPVSTESPSHRIMKANIMKILRGLGSNNTSYENVNIDVVSQDFGIAVECGASDGVKLLDFFNGAFRDLKNLKEFWVATFYTEKGISNLHKFIRTTSS